MNVCACGVAFTSTTACDAGKQNFPVFYDALDDQPWDLVRAHVVEAHGLLDLIGRAQPEQAAGLANGEHLQHVAERSFDIVRGGLEVRIGERRVR